MAWTDAATPYGLARHADHMVASRGAFAQSDLTRRGPRQRAYGWVCICLFFLVALVVVAVADGRWYLLALAVVFGLWAAQTLRRLHATGSVSR